MLFIGVRRYTAAYPKLLAKYGAECWTVDIDAKVTRWGAKGRHEVLDAQLLDRHFAPGYFDSVVLSGVFGYGVNTEAQQNAVFAAVGTVLKHEGVLVLGWNTDLVPEPLHRTEMQRFSATCLAGRCSRVEFTGSTHVFDFFRNARRPAAAP